MESDEAGRQRRTPLELLTMLAVIVSTTLFAALLVFGLPALFVVRTLEAGASPAGFVWGALASAWIGVIVYALVSDAETRGWLVFGLVGWVYYVALALRRSFSF